MYRLILSLIFLFSVFFCQAKPVGLVEKEYNNKEFDSLFSILHRLQYGKVKMADKMVKRMDQISLENGRPYSMESKLIYQKISNQYAIGEIQLASIKEAESLLKLTDSTLVDFSQAVLCLALSKAYLGIGEYAGSLSMGLRGLSLFTKLGNINYTAASNNILGNILGSIQEYEEAIFFQEKALHDYRQQKDTFHSLTCHLNIYTSRFFINDKRAVIDSTLYIIQQIEKYNDTSILAFAYMHLGLRYAIVGESELSAQSFAKVLSFCKSVDNDNISVFVTHNLGFYYLQKGRADSSYVLFKEVENVYLRKKDPGRLMLAYGALAKSLSILQRYKEAFTYQEKHDSIKESLLGSQKISEIQKIRAKKIVGEYKAQLGLKEKEILLKKKQNTILSLSFGLGILVIFLLSYMMISRNKLYSQQRKIKEMEAKKMSQQIEAGEKIACLEREKLRTEIDAKNREISSSLLLINSKNELLKKIMQFSDTLRKEKALSEEYAQRLDSMIKYSIKADDEWTYFKLHFEKVHPHFFKKLRAYPLLTENDLRLCAYIKIGMRAKQIAQMTNISADSVKANRYRLKKRLKLSEHQDLDEFIERV